MLSEARIQDLGNLYLEHPGSYITPLQRKEVRDYIDSEFAKIPMLVNYVSDTPYKSYEEMHHRVIVCGEPLHIYSGGSQSELLGAHHNLKFRAVHDWHHLCSGSDLSVQGEWSTYLHAITTTTQQFIKSVLFSEIVLQSSAYVVHGNTFPDTQKLVLL